MRPSLGVVVVMVRVWGERRSSVYWIGGDGDAGMGGLVCTFFG